MSGVFINYRVDDEPMAAQLLRQSLVERFGEQNVFYASKSIPPGRFFDDEILSALHSCGVFVAVIGPRWLSVADENGVRRLEDPQDWVRREISTALGLGIPVVPILVQDAPMPAPQQLPDDVRDLSRCNYRRLGHRFGDQDLAAIAEWLEPLMGRSAQSGRYLPGHDAMTKDNDPHEHPPTVIIGHITCDVASSAVLEGMDLAGAARGGSHYLVVSIPVTARSVDSAIGFDLVVSAELHAPRGHTPPVAYVPSRSMEHAGIQTTTSGKASTAPGVGALGGSPDRTANREELVGNVVGVGTERLEWTIFAGLGQLAGSQEFLLLVRQEQARLSWLEVTAHVSAARRFLRHTPPQIESAHAWSPLVTEASPQAATTLVLLEGRETDAPRFYLGRPLDLPLSVTADGLTVWRTEADGAVIGTIRWFDSVNGRPGFQWIQKSSARVVMGEGSRTEIHTGATVLLESGSVLRFPEDHHLRVMYDGAYTAGRATIRSALDMEVLVHGVVVATHRTESAYVTIGRSLKDITIDRPDISRLHGVLELFDHGWSYTHQSGACDAMLMRDGEETVEVHRGSAVRIARRDTLLLNEHVSLSIG